MTVTTVMTVGGCTVERERGGGSRHSLVILSSFSRHSRARVGRLEWSVRPMSTRDRPDARGARVRPKSTSTRDDDGVFARIQDDGVASEIRRVPRRLRRRSEFGRVIVLTCAAVACAIAARPSNAAYYANRRLGAGNAGVQRSMSHGSSAYDGVLRTSKHANYVGDEIKRHVSFKSVDMPEVSKASASGASGGDADVDVEDADSEPTKPKRRNAISYSPEEAKKLRERLGIATDAEEKEDVKKESLVQKQTLRGKAGKQRRNAISLTSAEAKALRDELTPKEDELIDSTPEEKRSDGDGDGADDDEEVGDGDSDGS